MVPIDVRKRLSNMQTPYFMESPDEVQRLSVKDRTALTKQQLIDTDIQHYLKPGCCIVDAGSGVGVISEQIAGIARDIGVQPDLVLLDLNQDRLHAAEARLDQYVMNKTFLTCNIENIPLPDKSVDYLFCRFVFEYLKHPDQVFREFIRVMKPGGKLVVGDLDNNAISHYPLTAELQQQLDAIVVELQTKCHFDFYAGRKLYSYFYRHQCQNIDIHFYAHHLFFGGITEGDDFNWSVKLDRLADLQNAGVIKLDFPIIDFAKSFLELLRSPQSFTYTPLIMVEGVVNHV